MSDSAMMPCDHVIAKLWEYLDGSLDELRSEEVKRHLDMCARCFPEYDFRRAYLLLMKRCANEHVPPELRRQIFSMVLEPDGNGGDGGNGGGRALADPRAPGFLARARAQVRRLLGYREG